MKLLLALENHFWRSREGHFHADGPANYSIWSRYLEVFDEVLLLARVSPGSRAGSAESRADGRGVAFHPLPNYTGPWQYLWQLPELKRQVRRAVASCDAYILRVPGLAGRLAWQEIRRLGKPYALDVLGDPWDALAPGTWPSLLRPFFRRAGARHLRRVCRGAVAVHYVTAEALQKRYPPGQNAYAVGFSDTLMNFSFASEEILRERYRRIEALCEERRENGVRIGFIGSFAQLYKGPDVLLRAAAICRRRGLELQITFVGEGRQRAAMQDLAGRLGMAKETHFAGQVPYGPAVLAFLDSIDLFVMPSRAEGLPRALLEAMARGCACIGTQIGGIPELLEAEDLVPAGNSDALAAKILEVSRDPERLTRMSQRNFRKAREQDPSSLAARRRAFYRVVRERSAGAAANAAPCGGRATAGT